VWVGRQAVVEVCEHRIWRHTRQLGVQPAEVEQHLPEKEQHSNLMSMRRKPRHVSIK